MSDQDHQQRSRQSSMDRRSVLRAVSLAAVATPVAAAISPDEKVESGPGVQTPEYHETDYTRRYYALSRRF